MLFTGASMSAAVTSILAGVGAALLLDTAGVAMFGCHRWRRRGVLGIRPAHAVDVSPRAAGDGLMPDSQRRHLGNCTAASGQGCAAELRANWREVAGCRHAKPGVFFPIGAAGPTRQQIDQDKRKSQRL
jgi:hypothetical protein